MSSGNDTTTQTITSPPLHTPTLPFDLIPEILCRLPVKLLLQLKCVCKSWKSLITDPKFAKKHLHMSKTYHHHHHVIVKVRDSLHWDATISTIVSDTSTTSCAPQLQLICPEAINNIYTSSRGFFSCDGILLIPGILRFATDQHSALLWNPSTRKFKILPPLLNPPERVLGCHDYYTLGYDRFIDDYKVFVVTDSRAYLNFYKVSVYTLGTDSWRMIGDFPYSGVISQPGAFVSGTVNWLLMVALVRFTHVIVSFDLENESYRTLLLSDLNTNPLSSHGLVVPDLGLGVLRDCLCIFANGFDYFDIWILKEYGIQESWTKLFSVPQVGDRGFNIYTKVVYVSEDDQVLLDFKVSRHELKLVVYNSTNGNFRYPGIPNISAWMVHEVYVESLISPCY